MFCLLKLYNNLFFFVSFFLSVVCIRVYLFPFEHKLSLSFFRFTLAYFTWQGHLNRLSYFIFKENLHWNSFVSIFKQKWSNPQVRSLFVCLITYVIHLNQANVLYHLQLCWHLNRIKFRIHILSTYLLCIRKKKRAIILIINITWEKKGLLNRSCSIQRWRQVQVEEFSDKNNIG